MRALTLVAGAACVLAMAVAADAHGHGHGRGHGPGPGRGPGAGGGGDRPAPDPTHLLARAADADLDGATSADEIAAFLDALPLLGDGSVDVAALVALLPAPPGPARGEGPPPLDEALAAALDTDADGAVSVEEVAAAFAALDTDGDGALGEADRPEPAPYRPHPMGGRARKSGRFVVFAADTDASGDVAADEWQAFLDALGADENGVIDAAALLALLPAPPEGSRAADMTDEERAAKVVRILDLDHDDVLELDDLAAVFDALDADDDGALSADELAKRRPC